MLLAWLSATACADDSQSRSVSIEVDFGQDLGQAWGTLWEATDDLGRPVAGAGFQSAYNTQDRSDRLMLHVYVRTTAPTVFQTELLPRPSSDAGTYLYGNSGELFSYGRNAIDRGLRRWDASSRQWILDPQTIPLSVQVQGLPLAVDQRTIWYGGKPVLELPEPADGEIGTRFGEWYYAGGYLIVRQFSPQAEGEVNDLVAYAWSPQQTDPLDVRSGIRQKLTRWGEFIYCFGQTTVSPSQNLTVAASNLGSVHCLEQGQWKTVREPDGKSFQIYAAIQHRDRLLFGQYPTGELFAWAGPALRHLKGQPPVMEGVSRNAREAQTLAIYGGQLHVGVWPWGEVWRQDAWAGNWEFLGRLFTHPQPTDQWTHPYEPETTALDPVLNRWGQRVTSMVPMGDSLYISTSAKGPNPYEPKFTFLDNDKHLEYGAVHRYSSPGCLAVPIRWKNGATRLDFVFSRNRMEVQQDGASLGVAEWDVDNPSLLDEFSVSLASGVYGPFGGRSVKQEEPSAKLGAAGMRGAYLHLPRHLGPQTDPTMWPEIFRNECQRMRQIGIRCLMPFVSDSSGRAHYNSSLMRRVYPSADPVALLAKELRQNDIGFHPVIPIIVCGGEEPQGVLREHPEWALRNPDGSPMGYISPAHPDARKWLVEVVREVVSQYSPDGVLLDYIRYANRPHRLDPESEKRFQATLPEDCSREVELRRFQEFKEAELTELVRTLSEAVRELAPEIPIGAYVWGHHVANDHLIAQVWPRWVQAGYLDAVNVSGYCHRQKYGDRFYDEFRKRMQGAIEVNRQLPKPARLSFALGVITSHGRVESAADILGYQKIGEELGLDGWIYFTWEYLQPYLEELPRDTPRQPVSPSPDR